MFFTLAMSCLIHFKQLAYNQSVQVYNLCYTSCWRPSGLPTGSTTQTESGSGTGTSSRTPTPCDVLAPLFGATWTSCYCRPMTSLIGRILSEERRREGWWWNTNQWFLSLPVKWWRGVHLGIEQMCIKIDIVFSYDDGINFEYSKTRTFYCSHSSPDWGTIRIEGSL